MFMAEISKLALIQTLGIIANWYANDTLMRCYRLQIYKAWTGGPWITTMCTVRGSLLWNSFKMGNHHSNSDYDNQVYDTLCVPIQRRN